MNKITSTQTNYTGAAAGYAEGTFKDDPGDGSGSSIIVKNFNDLWYAVNTPILKYTTSDLESSYIGSSEPMIVGPVGMVGLIYPLIISIDRDRSGYIVGSVDTFLTGFSTGIILPSFSGF